MLWIALHFPRLPLESLLQTQSQSDPWAIADGAHVAACNAQACAAGVRPGMKISAACALAPGLHHQLRDLKAETAALEQLATWATRYTPSVSLQPPCGLLLEIEGSLGLLGGLRAILASMRSDLAAMGYTFMPGCAPTASAAWLLARGGGKQPVSCKRLIEAALAPLPVAVLDCSAQTLDTLHAVGVKTLGDFLQLPRAGTARRFGQRLLDQLDRALGRLPEARQFHVPPATFSATLDLGAPVADTETLLFAARRLLVQLAGYLASRCAGVHRFRLVLVHEDAPASALEIGLVAPTRDAVQFTALVRDRLAACALSAPACAMRLEADEILTLAGDTRSLFQNQTGESADWETLVNRLRARLGNEAVSSLSARAEHRPERAWHAVAPGTKAGAIAQDPPPRPLWLLEQPQPLQEVASRPHYQDGPLALIAGPERIESGWWDGADIKRDYFVAETTRRSTVWVYRERLRPGGWYLHGIFG